MIAADSTKCGKRNDRFLYRPSAKKGTKMLDAFSACLEARDPTKGHFRSYRLEAGTDLLGNWLVDITYGRIGARGRQIRHLVTEAAEAKKLVKHALRRRSTAKKRIGTGYRFIQLHDPNAWLSLELD